MEEKTNHIIKKIAVIGAESTGKSTLCEALAKYYNTVFVPEYARTYFENHDINDYTSIDLEIISKEQIALEQLLFPKANTYLFCDTSLITLKIWAKNQFNTIPNSILNSIHANDYDLYLLCNNDIPWISDEQRQHPHLRDELYERHIYELNELRVNFKIISGIGTQRLENAINIINSLDI